MLEAHGVDQRIQHCMKVSCDPEKDLYITLRMGVLLGVVGAIWLAGK